MIKLAGDVGLDEQQFHNALQDCKYRHAHQRALRHAYQEAGVTGVPMFVIGTEVVTGLQDSGTLEAVIQAELSASKKE